MRPKTPVTLRVLLGVIVAVAPFAVAGIWRMEDGLTAFSLAVLFVIAIGSSFIPTDAARGTGGNSA